MDTTILTEPAPAIPGPVRATGAYLPGLVPGAAAGQYGAPLAMPGGPVVVFGPAHADGSLRSPLDRGAGAIGGQVAGGGAPHIGTADGR
jgi:hypothetical protein